MLSASFNHILRSPECRKRRIKCDERQPRCQNCQRRNVSCHIQDALFKKYTTVDAGASRHVPPSPAPLSTGSSASARPVSAEHRLAPAVSQVEADSSRAPATPTTRRVAEPGSAVTSPIAPPTGSAEGPLVASSLQPPDPDTFHDTQEELFLLKHYSDRVAPWYVSQAVSRKYQVAVLTRSQRRKGWICCIVTRSSVARS